MDDILQQFPPQMAIPLLVLGIVQGLKRVPHLTALPSELLAAATGAALNPLWLWLAYQPVTRTAILAGIIYGLSASGFWNLVSSSKEKLTQQPANPQRPLP